MACGECSLVSRKVAIGGGTVAAIRAIASSEMTPGPLGMAETRPKAEAPQAIASAASAGDLIQQIFILGRFFIGRKWIFGGDESNHFGGVQRCHFHF